MLFKYFQFFPFPKEVPLKTLVPFKKEASMIFKDLETIRNEKGLTKSELQNMLGLNNSYLTELNKGKFRANEKVVNKAIKVLKLNKKDKIALKIGCGFVPFKIVEKLVEDGVLNLYADLYVNGFEEEAPRREIAILVENIGHGNRKSLSIWNNLS
jgi:hypothetical protein